MQDVILQFPKNICKFRMQVLRLSIFSILLIEAKQSSSPFFWGVVGGRK